MPDDNSDLRIIIEAALDLEASIKTITEQMRQLQQRIVANKIKVTAGLDQAASLAQIQSDLQKIAKSKNSIKISGKIDKEATQAEIDKTIKQLKNAKIKLSPMVDPLDAAKQIKDGLPDVPAIEAKADVKVDGAEQVAELSRQMEAGGKSAAGLAANVYLARTAITALRTAAREAISIITELDQSVTNLAMATGKSREGTYDLLQDYNKLAGQLGATTGQVADAADAWLRQGRSIAETTELITDAMILSKVSQLDSAQSTEYLTAAVKGYEVAARNVIGVVDKLTAVDLVSATDAGGLAEAMSRTAVTANMAGVSMDRLLGYVATVGEVTQKSMSSVGESFKTIFARMNDIKANKLQLVDEEGTTETLSDVEQTLKNVGIDLRKTVNEYNNYGDVLDNLAAKWDTLNKVQQNALAKAFAGTRQAENFRVLMQNYSAAMQYMDVAANSAGSAAEKFELYQESIEAKAASFAAAVESLTLDTIDTGFIGDLIDAGTAIIDFVDKIGLLKSALIGLGVGGLFKGVEAISDKFNTVKQSFLNLGTALRTLDDLEDVGKLSGETMGTLGKLCKELNDDQLRLVLTSRQLSTAQMTGILTASGLTDAEAAQKLETLGLATAQNTAAVSTGGLSAAMTGLGASIKAAIISNPIGVIMVGVSALAMATEAVTRAQEEARQAAIDAANEYESDAKTIKDYQDRVVDLKNSLDAGNLSEQEAYDVRKELLSIQDEIKDAYGAEAAAIDLVSGSADNAVASLRNLTAALATQNLIEQATQVSESITEMTKDRTVTSGRIATTSSTTPEGTTTVADPEVIRRIREVIAEYKDVTLKAWNEGGGGYGASGLELSITADARGAKEVMTNLTADFQALKKELESEGLDLSGTFLDSNNIGSIFTEGMQELNDVIEEFGNIFDQQIQWKIAVEPDYAAIMNGISDAKEAMSDAMLSGDNDALQSAINTIMAMAIDPNDIQDESVREYMAALLADLQNEAEKQSVKIKLDPEIGPNDLVDSVKEALSGLEGEDGTITVTAIRNAEIDYKNTDENDEGSIARAASYQALNDAVAEYGLTVEDLIPILVQYGYVVNDVSNDLDQNKVDVEALSDVLSELSDAYDLTKTAQEEMRDAGGLSADTINDLAEADENYLDYLYEENGAIKLNTEAWLENANQKMRGDLVNLQAEIDDLLAQNDALRENIELYQEKLDAGDTTEDWAGKISEATGQIDENTEAIKRNQGVLAVYSSLYGSVAGDMTAYTNALNNFANVKNTVDDVTSSFQTLADLQSEVANGFTMSLDKALEFAAVYPEILNNAQMAADGQITLDDEIVNHFIENKQNEINGEIDAKIQQLEAEKEYLTAKMDSAKAQLELAKNVGEGEGQISKETAEYRINVGNALTSALIDMGIDEATAYKLAAAAMAGNQEEFAEVCKGAFQNMDDNAVKAAYNMAHAIYVNANNSCNSISDIAAQAHETAKAISSMGNGIIAGTSANQFGGIDGKQTGGLSLDLYHGDFKGADFDYDDHTVSLDDYVSQLELDISEYEKAISQIDGQIAVLQSLKNVPLEKFQSATGTGGSGSGSGGKGGSGASAATKEVEEYIATLDKYREALERLRKAQETRSEIQQKIDNSDDYKEQILLQNELIGAYQREQDALHNLNNQRDSTIMAGAQALRELGFAVEYNAETNEFWIDNLEHLNELQADSQGDYETMQEATNALRQETESLINSLEDLNEANREGSENWMELSYSIKDAKAEIQELLDKIVEDASQAVDTMQDVYDTLHTAADEYASSGFITVDTLQEIKDLGMEYLAYLIDENGQLVINEERIRDVVAARTQQLVIEQSLTYIEALRIAKSEGDIETMNRLLYATEETTDATWGLVYANLQLLGLSDEEYNAALSHINALRALTDEVCMSIGKTADSVTDTLNDMKDGLDDILKYVMDMLKHRIEEQIDALEDMKDAYGEIIDLKKESLDTTKEEADYQKDVSKKLKEMAKLQAQIDALSLDDSREAQAERAKLMEEMSELQEDLSDTQNEHAIDAQKDALDTMKESYDAEKDAEIAKLEESISSEEKLYQMAIDYIRDHWDTLYSELIDYNYNYGNVLNSEITTAWDNALAAAQRYGDYVTALDSIDADIAASQSSGSGGGMHTQVGNTYYSDKATNEDMVRAIVGNMKSLAAQWSGGNTKSLNDSLHQKAEVEASKLAQYGVKVRFDGASGNWYIEDDKLHPENIGKLLYQRYHSGGIVGGGDLKANEQFAKLKDNEWVLSEQMVNNLMEQMSRIDTLAKLMAGAPDFFNGSVLSDLLNRAGGGTANNVTNNNGRPVQINIGDTIIQGSASPETVQAHIKVTRDMVSDIAKILGIGY